MNLIEQHRRTAEALEEYIQHYEEWCKGAALLDELRSKTIERSVRLGGKKRDLERELPRVPIEIRRAAGIADDENESLEEGFHIPEASLSSLEGGPAPSEDDDEPLFGPGDDGAASA